MIFKLKQWCEGIIVAIIISVIIEMLIPDNKSKKYVKVIIGIYILFVSLTPLLEILNYDWNFNDLFNLDTVAVSSNIDNKIKDVYVLGIEEKIREDIKSLGYSLENLQVLVDSNYEKIEEISVKINGKLEGNIIKIENISVGKNDNKKDKYSDIVSLLVNEYLVEEEKIFIF